MSHYPFGPLCAWRCGSVVRGTNAWVGPHGLRCVALPENGPYRRWADVPMCPAEHVTGRAYCQPHLDAAYEQDADYIERQLRHAAKRAMRGPGAQSGSISAW